MFDEFGDIDESYFDEKRVLRAEKFHAWHKTVIKKVLGIPFFGYRCLFCVNTHYYAVKILGICYYFNHRPNPKFDVDLLGPLYPKIDKITQEYIAGTRQPTGNVYIYVTNKAGIQGKLSVPASTDPAEWAKVAKHVNDFAGITDGRQWDETEATVAFESALGVETPSTEGDDNVRVPS